MCQALWARPLTQQPRCGELSPTYKGLMCYNAREACALRRHIPSRLTDDILVAYPTVQASTVKAVYKLLAEDSSTSHMLATTIDIFRLPNSPYGGLRRAHQAVRGLLPRAFISNLCSHYGQNATRDMGPSLN